MPNINASSLKDLPTAKIDKNFITRALFSGHRFLFGAIAELVDNSSDANAKTIEIWCSRSKKSGIGKLLYILDDGCGMSHKELVRICDLGWTNKQNSESTIGMHGIGLKRGCLRIGEDMLLITKRDGVISVLMLSSTLMKDPINPDQQPVLSVPAFDAGDFSAKLSTSNQDVDVRLLHNTQVELIERYGPFDLFLPTLKELSKRLPADSGTLVICYRLLHHQRTDDEELKTYPGVDDIFWTPDDVHGDFGMFKTCYGLSLKLYLSLLYWRPKFRLLVENGPVQSRFHLAELFWSEFFSVNLPSVDREKTVPVKIYSGINLNLPCAEGILYYFNGRLVHFHQHKRQKSTDCQSTARGVCVMVNFDGKLAKPDDEKQNCSNEHVGWINLKSKCEDRLNFILAEFSSGETLTELNKVLRKSGFPASAWIDRTFQVVSNPFTDRWLQCSNCLKWRRLERKSLNHSDSFQCPRDGCSKSEEQPKINVKSPTSTLMKRQQTAEKIADEQRRQLDHSAKRSRSGRHQDDDRSFTGAAVQSSRSSHGSIGERLVASRAKFKSDVVVPVSSSSSSSSSSTLSRRELPRSRLQDPPRHRRRHRRVQSYREDDDGDDNDEDDEDSEEEVIRQHQSSTRKRQRVSQPRPTKRDRSPEIVKDETFGEVPFDQVPSEELPPADSSTKTNAQTTLDRLFNESTDSDGVELEEAMIQTGFGRQPDGTLSFPSRTDNVNQRNNLNKLIQRVLNSRLAHCSPAKRPHDTIKLLVDDFCKLNINLTVQLISGRRKSLLDCSHLDLVEVDVAGFDEIFSTAFNRRVDRLNAVELDRQAGELLVSSRQFLCRFMRFIVGEYSSSSDGGWNSDINPEDITEETVVSVTEKFIEQIKTAMENEEV